MVERKVVDYDEKNIEDYKELAVLLHYYYSGVPMKKEFLDKIACAKPEHKLLALNLYEKQEMGITKEYAETLPNETEELCKALVLFYYGDKKQLTVEQLHMIALATDEEKAWALENYKILLKNHQMEEKNSKLM